MSEMKYVEIPYVNKKVSRILYGTAMSPFIMGGDGNDLLDMIYAAGVTTFNTARNYLASEKSLGRWSAEKNMRDKIVLLSKCAHPSMLLFFNLFSALFVQKLSALLWHFQFIIFIKITLLAEITPVCIFLLSV